MLNIAINGFGRIGRLVFRGMMAQPDIFNVIAINDLTDAATLAHLLKHDSVHGVLPDRITSTGTCIFINDREIKVYSEKDPADLPWMELNIGYVVESSGVFCKRAQAAKHLEAGAKKVVITAPAKDEVDATIVLGVNSDTLRPEHEIVSNASCTTNCLAPVMKVITDNFQVESAFMTTIHSYTGDQRLIDAPHKDLRRARAAAVNIVPTTTGAAVATGKVIPALQGKIDGLAVRVPTPDVSLVDVVIYVNRETSISEVNSMMKNASEGYLKNILEYSEAPLVSTDIIHNPHSSIFDAQSTMVNGRMIKILSWYDNEWGYSQRVIDLLRLMAED